MPRLPQTIDFNESDHPDLADIFHSIDAGIAAIVASDPTFRPKTALKRRVRAGKSGRTATGLRRTQRKAA